MAPRKSSKSKVDDPTVSDKDREAAETSRRLQEAALHAGVSADPIIALPTTSAILRLASTSSTMNSSRNDIDPFILLVPVGMHCKYCECPADLCRDKAIDKQGAKTVCR